MVAAAGIAAFFLALLLSYQIFPDPGTGNLEYAGWRFVFTILVTIGAAVIAGKGTNNRRVDRERREAEMQRDQEHQERRAEQERIQSLIDREETIRSAALRDAKSRVHHLRGLLTRDEHQRSISGHRLGRHAFGVVSDQLLADIVWESLHTPWAERTTITAEQMESLAGELVITTYRNQSGKFSLEGMQYATNIEALSLNPLDDYVDLGPISGLTNLKRLEIRRGKGITSIDALATLDGIEQLTLAYLPNVRDFRPLAGLERLVRLELTSLSDALDFSPISGLIGLTALHVGHMRWINNLDGVSNVRQLRQLVLCSIGDLEDLSPLAKFSKLESLWIEQTHTPGICRMPALKSLRSVKLQNITGVGNLDALSNLSEIEEIEINTVRLDPYRYEFGKLNLGPLSKLRGLRKATLIQGDQYTSFSNWESISLNRSLVEVEVGGDLGATTVLHAISSLNQLREFRISSAIMPELRPLSALAQLERLAIRGEWIEAERTRLGDLKTLTGLRQLHTIVIDTCQGWRLIDDLGEFRQLRHLELKSCKVADEYLGLEKLANLVRLQTLVLRENSSLVRDLSPLVNLTLLRTLVVVTQSHESPWDTSPLEHIEGLTVSTK